MLRYLRQLPDLKDFTEQRMSGMKFKIQVIITACLFTLIGCGDSAPPLQPVSNDSEALATFGDDYVSQYEFEESTDLSAA